MLSSASPENSTRGAKAQQKALDAQMASAGQAACSAVTRRRTLTIAPSEHGDGRRVECAVQGCKCLHTPWKIGNPLSYMSQKSEEPLKRSCLRIPLSAFLLLRLRLFEHLEIRDVSSEEEREAYDVIDGCRPPEETSSSPHLLHDLLLFDQERSNDPVLHAVPTPRASVRTLNGLLRLGNLGVFLRPEGWDLSNDKI